MMTERRSIRGTIEVFVVLCTGVLVVGVPWMIGAAWVVDQIVETLY